METSKKNILLVITNGFAATNVIHSGLIKSLSEAYQIHILSDLIQAGDIEKINAHYHISLKLADLKVPVENRSVRLLRRFQKAVFFEHFQIQTQKIKARKDASYSNIMISLVPTILRFTKCSGWLLIRLRKHITKLTRKENLRQKLQSLPFDGIISTSPLDIRENAIVNSMPEHVKTAAMVISWDNLTSKGLINADHDYVFVWNKFMKTEYENFYNICKPKNQTVIITGIPRFDLYFTSRFNTSRLEFLSKFCMQPQSRIVLFATSAATHFPEQTDILRHLIEYAQRRNNVIILVRCHSNDDFLKYDTFKNHEKARIWFPEKLSNRMQSIPALDALTSLAEMLKHCEVCVNVASTMRIDAAACKKHVISIAYDGDSSKPDYQSVSRLYNYDHQLPLNAIQPDRLVYSKNELFITLDTCLSDKNKWSAGKNSIEDFTAFLRPDSIPTIMTSIKQWLG